MEPAKGPKILYQMVIDGLMEKIGQRSFSFDVPLCTEKQLAEEYHVSNITAKRAIKELELRGILYRKRGVGSFVSRDIFSEEEKEAVSATEQTKIFAFVLPFHLAPGSVFMEMVQVLNNMLNPKRGFVSIYMTEGGSLKERETLMKLQQQGISGVIYYPQKNCIHLDLLLQFTLQGVPVIILNKTDSTPYFHNVQCDNYGGQKLLTEYLISLGHQRIGYITSFGLEENTSVNERLGGYLTALKQAGLPLRQEFIVQNLDRDLDGPTYPLPDKKADRIRKAIRQFTDSGVTAIECDNDGLAYYVMKFCQEMGIHIPKDMSVTGFDGYLNQDNPELHTTTVYQDFHQIAEKVGELLVHSMDGAVDGWKKIILKAEVVTGSTTGPCPKPCAPDPSGARLNQKIEAIPYRMDI